MLLLLCCCCLWLCRGLERQLAEKTLGESPSSLRSRLAKLEVALAGKADAAEVRLQLERRPQRAEFSAVVAERASVLEQRAHPRLFSAPGVFLKDDGGIDGYIVQHVLT